MGCICIQLPFFCRAFQISTVFWRLSQRSGVVLNAREKRNAISTETAALPFTMAEIVLRETPISSANAAMLSPRGSRYISLRISPGMEGFLVRSIVSPLSMVILIIDHVGVSVLKTKRQPPVCGYCYTPKALKFPFQHMQAGTRKIHIRRCASTIEQVKNHSQAAGMPGLNALCASCQKERLQPFVCKRLNHNQYVTNHVTQSKRALLAAGQEADCRDSRKPPGQDRQATHAAARNKKTSARHDRTDVLKFVVEKKGFEPSTPALRRRCSPS